jgi:hypothetical protein
MKDMPVMAFRPIVVGRGRESVASDASAGSAGDMGVLGNHKEGSHGDVLSDGRPTAVEVQAEAEARSLHVRVPPDSWAFRTSATTELR